MAGAPRAAKESGMSESIDPRTFRQCIFSPCRRYRYTLWREWTLPIEQWDPSRYAVFIGLNPSTADELVNDPTIRRCIDFANRWGYGAL